MTTTSDVRDALDDLARDTRPPSVGLADTALRRARRRRHATRGVIAGVAVAAAVSVAMSVLPDDATPDTTVPPAGAPDLQTDDDPPAQQDSVSQELDTGGLPLLLIDDPAWEVAYASGIPAESGEIEMTDGARHFQLNWFPADQLDRYIDDRRHSADMEEVVTILGYDAAFFRYEGSRGYTTLWQHDDVTLEARGQDFADRASYEAVLEQLVEVDADTWLAALPAGTVAPSDQDAAVAEMLADIPTPIGFDVSAGELGAVQDRYQLGVQVATAALCAWTTEWIAATEAGDDASADEAVAAITSAYDWAILQEMDEQGDYPEVIWEIVDHVENGDAEGSLPVDMLVEPPDPDQPLDKYRNSFGCAK